MKDYYKNLYQTLFINEAGFITFSTDLLFSTIELKKQSTLVQFPFITSIFESLLKQPIGRILQFHKIKTIHSFLPGIYDYMFIKTPTCNKCGDVLIWTIVDKTSIYQDVLTAQQVNQEYLIKSEKHIK